VENIHNYTKGAMLAVQTICENRHIFKWTSRFFKYASLASQSYQPQPVKTALIRASSDFGVPQHRGPYTTKRNNHRRYGKRARLRKLLLQETHKDEDQNRPKINGMTLIIERPHNKYGKYKLLERMIL